MRGLRASAYSSTVRPYLILSQEMRPSPCRNGQLRFCRKVRPGFALSPVLETRPARTSPASNFSRLRELVPIQRDTPSVFELLTSLHPDSIMASPLQFLSVEYSIRGRDMGHEGSEVDY